MSETADNAPPHKPFAKSPGRRRKILIFSMVALVNVGLFTFLLVQLLTPAPVSDPLVGHAAPGFSLAVLEPTSAKGTLSLSDFKGRAIVLNFWASWCAPCQEELPLLENSWKQAQAQGKNVIFLGIDFQESNNTATNFLRQNNVTYPAVVDVNGSVASKYFITSLPDTIFIDQHGIVKSRILRQLTSSTLSSNLQLIL